MMKAERAALRALADKATPGPWEICVGQLVWGVTEDDPGLTCSGCGGVASKEHWLMAEPVEPADARYIAACSPERIMALLDRVDRLTEALRWQLDRHNENYACGCVICAKFRPALEGDE